MTERMIAAILDVAMASCLEPPRLFGGAKLPPTGALWAEAYQYASDVINMMARVKDKPDMLLPYRMFYGRAPFCAVAPISKAGTPRRVENREIQTQGSTMLLLEQWQ